MTGRSSILPLVSALAACSPFSANETPVPDAAARGADAAADAGKLDAGEGSPTTCAAIFCEPFDSLAAWAVDPVNPGGTTMLDPNRFFKSAPSSFESHFDAPLSTNKHARRQRAVTTNGRARWTSAVYIEAHTIPDGVAERLFEVVWGDKTKGFELENTANGLKLTVLPSNEIPGARMAASPNVWLSISIEFDLPGRHLAVLVDNQPIPSLNADGVDFSFTGDEATLLIGLVTDHTLGPVSVWYDDMKLEAY